MKQLGRSIIDLFVIKQNEFQVPTQLTLLYTKSSSRCFFSHTDIFLYMLG